MKLTVFGATGRVGGHVVAQALAAGHDVTAVVRDPDRLAAAARAARVVTATFDDVGHRRHLVAAVAGRDAVISAVGARRRADAGVATEATAAIVAAMSEAGVRRIAVVSAVPVDPPGPEAGFVMGRVAMPILRRVFADVYADLHSMEQLLRDSDVAWTSVRSPRLTNGPLTGRYRSRLGAAVPGGTVITRADLADALLRAITDDEQIAQIVGVARSP